MTEKECDGFFGTGEIPTTCQICDRDKVEHDLLDQYPELVSIDLETTGLVPSKHAVLEIGAIHATTGKEFQVKTFPPSGEVTVHKGALEVNKVDLVAHANEAHSYSEAEQLFNDWIDSIDGVGRKKLIPIGYNVGSFDMEFLANTMPLIRRRFHGYHEIEINSLVRTRDVARGQRMFATRDYYKKKLAQEYTHSALDDARHSLAVFLEIAGYDSALYFDGDETVG